MTNLYLIQFYGIALIVAAATHAITDSYICALVAFVSTCAYNTIERERRRNTWP